MSEENKNPEEEFRDDFTEDSDIPHHDRVEEIEISKEMKDSFLDYSMSVIVSRALPDIRDGLKPVHRRILYAMNTLNMTPGSAHKKSARIVGEVIGKYHPHGDTAVYEAMVRMAQDFSYRYPLVDGHGNFGSLDGDGAAAMRYTEARMSKISMEMVADLNKNTVDFMDNYDGDEQEPVVLPSKIPNLILNGAVGIAVGMATNIPPHNLNETVAAIEAVMNDPDISIPELMNYLPGPDFPTGGRIMGRAGIREAYETGKGTIIQRAKYKVEEIGNGKKRIIFYEIPYNVNKMKLFEKMADVIKNKIVQGVTYLNDESNREGVRIVMELRKDVQEDVVINQMFRETPLQNNFAVNMLALKDGRPVLLSIKDLINGYIDHQTEVITRRVQFDLNKALDRLHIVLGFIIAFDHLDDLIHMIRYSQKDEAGLIADMNEGFGLDEVQSKAILAMQIRRLSGLEFTKLEDEKKQLEFNITDYRDILANHSRILQIIRENLEFLKNRYGDARRTEIDANYTDMLDEDLIPENNIVVTLTDSGYIKAQEMDNYTAQNRGGKGIKALNLNEEDTIERMATMSNHDFVLLFTNLGRVYRLKGYQIPVGSRTAKGVPIVNVLPLQNGESVEAMLPYRTDTSIKNLLFVTKNGIVKRTPVEEFKNINRNGKMAISLNEDDSLEFIKGTTGNDEVFIANDQGNTIRFDESEVRLMGRQASGVGGMNVNGGKVVGVTLSSEGDTLFVLSENGYGKRSRASDYRKTSRNKKGVRTMNVTEKTGPVVDMRAVHGDEDALIVTSNGQMIRIRLNDVGIYSRNTQGIKIITPSQGDHVRRMTLAPHDEEEPTLPLPEQLEEELPVAEGELEPAEVNDTSAEPEKSEEE